MKKTLLLCAAALFSLMASAGDGLVAVGANIIVLPSSRWDGDIEWKAWTWVYNSATDYGDPYNETNGHYNQICGALGPEEDEAGLQWFEPGFDMGPKDGDRNFDQFDEEGNDLQILWEEHTAPFSSDETYNGKTSYRWTTNNIMADIYVRRTFTTDQLLSGPVYLACGHDDAPAEYYINGELVFEVTDGWNNNEYILLTDEQKALIKLNGEENLIAFHVHQNWGGSFADCGLYTRIEGGLDMGYTEPWEGKVLFNSYGGYNWDLKSPSNNPKHPWSALYEAQEGDEYTFTMPGHSELDDVDYDWQEQLHFKTPIRIEEGREYSFKVRLETDKTFNLVTVKLTDNDDDDIELAYDQVIVPAPVEGEEYEGKLVELDFTGQEVSNFKIAFDFAGGEDDATVTIKEISLRDITEGDNEEDAVELWVGTHYFNFFWMCKRSIEYFDCIWDEEIENEDGTFGDYRQPQTDEEKAWAFEQGEYEAVYEETDAPEITGRVETMAWTQADFDDSMWDDQMMPVGSEGYMPEVQSIWPGGDNTNYWIRRNFELDKINDRLSYDLNVCHDDVYETYVNGHLLQKNVGWTNGKSPVQVHIPARYLNVGKNVIATYIQQNWGGHFYDCGINVMEVNYDECVQMFNDVLAYAQTDTLLTNRMKEDVQDLIAEAKQYFKENQNDPAEIRNYAREFRTLINNIFKYSNDVKTLKKTWDICRKMEDKGYWGTALQDAVAALDTCATSSQLSPYLNNLRDARKATAMERHTENYVGCVPQAVPMDLTGMVDYVDEETDEILLTPKYYLFNVGAKNFLGGGEAYGAHQAIEFASNPMMLIQATKNVLDPDTGEVLYDEDDNPVTEPIEGAYYIETFRPNGDQGVMDFLGWNGFVDVNMGNNLWELIPVLNNEDNRVIYNIAQYNQFSASEGKTYNGTEYPQGTRSYLGLRSGDNGYAPSYYIVDTDLRSPELATNQWMFISREEMLSFIKTANEDNPADLTFLINNPGYDQRWTIDDWIFSNGSVWGRGANHANFVLESYYTNEFNNYQGLYPPEEAEALPAGTYVLTVQGYYRDGDEGTHLRKYLAGQPTAQRAFIFAGPEEPQGSVPATAVSMPLMPIHVESGNYPGIGYYLGGMQTPGTYLSDQGFGAQPYSACSQAADDYFPCGLYTNEMAFYIPEDEAGFITFGIIKPFDEDTTPGDWIVMDNWRLWYYGPEQLDPDGIKGIESDEINKNNTASKSIYNMLGQRLSKVQKGVNIINGKKIIKK